MYNGHNYGGSTVISCERVDMGGECPEITYILTCGKIIDGENEERDSFSILCQAGEERVLLEDVTSRADRAGEIFRLFVDNAVTPIHAEYVIEELI